MQMYGVYGVYICRAMLVDMVLKGLKDEAVYSFTMSLWLMMHEKQMV